MHEQQTQSFIYTLRIHIIPLKPQNNDFKLTIRSVLIALDR